MKKKKILSLQKLSVNGKKNSSSEGTDEAVSTISLLICDDGPGSAASLLLCLSNA
ncbi:SapB/AmfS family lanthipeptide [Sorangium sp. So ce131]|uniref:SapB/AmfS family lanthipeptide n=1 Tax=Sorangium sp. So ce131 TaxID=3133282 RepID=UPI003F5F98CD